MSSEPFHAARQLLADAIENHAFPAASVEVGRADGPLWNDAMGHLTYDRDAAAATRKTLFDLASLTKVIATTTLAMHMVDAGTLEVDAPVGDHLTDWRGADRHAVTIRDLLAHCSGLTAYLPFFRDHAGRRDFEHAICTMRLEYDPRSRSIYSDLGFILLGFILETLGAEPLARQFEGITARLPREPLVFSPPKSLRDSLAPTEIDEWRGRLLVGEVHDENCWALGGAAGHAGLFGTAAAVGGFAQQMLRTIAGSGALASPAIAREFIRRREIPGSSRALGWDTMLQTSSCGTRMSAAAIGHTGFTGTSLWIDPYHDLYVVLLTNRVHPSRDNQKILTVRPAFHDLVMSALWPGEPPLHTIE